MCKEKERFVGVITMGLAASQARLLFITSRKTDCEFESMKIANQKLSLSRGLDALSDKYAKSLNATKLVWNTTTGATPDVTYNTLMKPNSINDYPILVTNAFDKVILDSQYAQAMGGGTSGNANSATRNEFIDRLLGEGTADSYPVNADLSSISGVGSSVAGATGKEATVSEILVACGSRDNGDKWSNIYANGKYDLNSRNYDNDDANIAAAQKVFNDFYSSVSNVLTDTSALAYAYQKTTALFSSETEQGDMQVYGYDHKSSGLFGMGHGSYAHGINMKNVINAFMTNYYNYLAGDYNGVNHNASTDTSTSNLVSADTKFNVNSSAKTEETSDTSGSDSSSNSDNNENASVREVVDYYDIVYQGIQQKGGWKCDNGVTDKDYLQNAIKNGKYFLEDISYGEYSKEAYQAGSSISEITDTEGVAEAQADYESEKQKINTKEKILDVKLQQLDTERAALDTEIDSVNEVIKKNIERSFKMFQA